MRCLIYTNGECPYVASWVLPVRYADPINVRRVNTACGCFKPIVGPYFVARHFAAHSLVTESKRGNSQRSATGGNALVAQSEAGKIKIFQRGGALLNYIAHIQRNKNRKSIGYIRIERRKVSEPIKSAGHLKHCSSGVYDPVQPCLAAAVREIYLSTRVSRLALNGSQWSQAILSGHDESGNVGIYLVEDSIQLTLRWAFRGIYSCWC